MNTKNQFIKFVGVGLCNTLFGYGLYALLLWIGLPLTYALLIATCIGVIFNFQTIGRFVFKDASIHFFLKFVSLYVFLFYVNLQTVSFLDQILHNPYSAGLIAVPPVAMLSFILNKLVVFRKVL